MISLTDLHDATLFGIEVDWEKGELHCTFRIMGKTRVQLLASGLTMLLCPRKFPWGRSISVNSARLDMAEKTGTLVIEMQSGDLIEASVGEIHIQELLDASS